MATGKHHPDIDIDVADRNKLLELIEHVPAQRRSKDRVERHASGVYVQRIPVEPLTSISSIYYKDADERGYFKLDILNVSVYEHIRDEQHYSELLARPIPWHRLCERAFVEKLIHVSSYYDAINQMNPDSITRLAMFLAAIRPAKRHLIGKPWSDIAKEIWVPVEGQYYFKKSHSVSYAHLVALHMRIIDESD